MSELPSGWAKVTLGELVQLRGERCAPSTVPHASFIGLEDIEPHTSRLLRIGTASEVKSSVTVYRKGDVLYSRLRPYLNKAIVAPFDGVASAEILALVPSGATTAEFVLRQIMAREFLEFAALLDKGDRPRVNFKEIATYPVALPPLPEQKRIVARIETLTARTAHTRSHLFRIQVLLEKYKDSLLKFAFEENLAKVNFDDCESSNKELTKTVGELICKIVAGKNIRCEERPPSNDERGVIKVSAVTWGNFDPRESKTLPESFVPADNTRIKAGDLLLSRANTLELVASVVIVKECPSNLYLSDKVLRLEMDEAEKGWLMWFLRSPQGRSEIEARATGNQISMRNLSQKQLRSIPVPWPPLNLRRETVRMIEEAFSWLDRLAAHHGIATELVPELDASIYAKAKSGELVPQYPNDEPARSLVARINATRPVAPQRLRKRRRKEKPMTQNAKESLLLDSESWPEIGLPFDEVAKRIPVPYEKLRDALFDLLGGDDPKLRQVFDEKAECMHLQKEKA